MISNADPLLKVPQLRPLQLVIQLWLTHQENLKEFFRRGFEIGQHPDFCKQWGVEILCFIDDKCSGFAVLMGF